MKTYFVTPAPTAGAVLRGGALVPRRSNLIHDGQFCVGLLRRSAARNDVWVFCIEALIFTWINPVYKQKDGWVLPIRQYFTVR